MQLDEFLQQLLQLANTLQAFAAYNKASSQQLQCENGATSKVVNDDNGCRGMCVGKACTVSLEVYKRLQVAEKLMLAHCEQELAQRANIVGASKATVQLPPFHQVPFYAENLIH